MWQLNHNYNTCGADSIEGYHITRREQLAILIAWGLFGGTTPGVNSGQWKGEWHSDWETRYNNQAQIALGNYWQDLDSVADLERPPQKKNNSQ